MKPKNIEFKTIGQDRVLQTILPYIKGKKVLDIGCVEHNLINKNKRRIWAHDFIVNNSKYSVGIDIQKEDISVLKYLRENGAFDVRRAIGEKAICTALSIEKVDFTSIIEPHLMRLSFVGRTTKGRVLTHDGIDFMNNM